MCWICRRTTQGHQYSETKSGNVGLTCQREQNEPVHHQHGPEHGQIERSEPSAHKCNENSLRRRVPEFEFWQPSYERSEFLLFCRKSAACPVLHSFVLFQRGIEFRRDEREEEVKEVDAQRICDCRCALALVSCRRRASAHQCTILSRIVSAGRRRETEHQRLPIGGEHTAWICRGSFGISLNVHVRIRKLGLAASLTRPILEVCAWTAAKGVSAGSGASMLMLRRRMRIFVGILGGGASLRG